ncbi:MAG: hypothetical protein DHS20C01_09590 [marine bacterium B5-7]|nr:MAG: hypothetical protein DHS20C01_09590 [marine bacterium B5-7]
MSGIEKLMPDVDRSRVYESRLVHLLSRDTAVYCTRSARLYFWESDNGQVRTIIERALSSMGVPYSDAPVIMDNKGVFNAPRKVAICAQAFATVAVALRLGGVRLRISDPVHIKSDTFPAKHQTDHIDGEKT